MRIYRCGKQADLSSLLFLWFYFLLSPLFFFLFLHSWLFLHIFYYLCNTLYLHFSPFDCLILFFSIEKQLNIFFLPQIISNILFLQFPFQAPPLSLTPLLFFIFFLFLSCFFLTLNSFYDCFSIFCISHIIHLAFSWFFSF